MPVWRKTGGALAISGLSNVVEPFFRKEAIRDYLNKAQWRLANAQRVF